MTDTVKKPDVGSMNISELQEFFVSIGEPKFRAKQLFSAYAAGKYINEITNFSNALREKLSKSVEYRMPQIEQKQVSKLDGTVKYLFRLHDGEYVESVLMKYAHGNTICVSSQVGCRMGCAFCASTIGGKVRDLTPSEIYGQVCAAQRDSGERIGGIVMMGIGEPLDNFDNVIKFLELVNSPDGLNIGYRHISLSTCGIVDKILKLSEKNLPITLSISLHSTTQEERERLMPIAKKFGIDELLSACRKYIENGGRRISFEYTMIEGENDSEEDALRLAKLLSGMLCHVNLIPLNTVKGRDYRKSAKTSIQKFISVLEKRGITATVRRRLGSDIDASCGQLRASKIESPAK